MDEYRRAESTDTLLTRSVHTCTAVAISLPGRFSYLAHIGPGDRIYGRETTDLFRQVCTRITQKEICCIEKQNLEVVVVAPHLRTIHRILDAAVKEGFFLSQIKFMYNPQALFADVTCTPADGVTTVYWKHGLNEETSRRISSRDVGSFQDLINPNGEDMY